MLFKQNNEKGLENKLLTKFHWANLNEYGLPYKIDLGLIEDLFVSYCVLFIDIIYVSHITDILVETLPMNFTFTLPEESNSGEDWVRDHLKYCFYGDTWLVSSHYCGVPATKLWCPKIGGSYPFISYIAKKAHKRT